MSHGVLEEAQEAQGQQEGFEEVTTIPADEQEALGTLPSADFSVIEFGNKRNVSGTYRSYYEAHGCRVYRSIDWNGKDGAYPLDVNHALHCSDVDLPDPADIVTNFGFSEHVSNQPMFWTNHHRLCRPGGLLCGVTPHPRHWPRHGILQPSGAFYRSLAEVNGYEVEALWVNSNRQRWTICYRFRKPKSDFGFVMPEDWEETIIPTERPSEQALRNSGLR